MSDEGAMIRRRRIGLLLRQYREAAGLTAAQVGERLGFSTAKVTRVETAKSQPKRRDVRAMLDLYDVDHDRATELLRLLRDSGRSGWWAEYNTALPPRYSSFIGYEQEAATTCWTYEPLVVPGLLQTEAYARATIRKTTPEITPDEVEARVEVRMQRQDVLTRPQRPLGLRTVICESALRRSAGDAALMREQYQQILTAAELPHVRIQVHLDRAGLLACVTGPFVIIDFPAVSDHSTIYLENGAGDLYLEKPRQLERYRLIWETLCGDALGVDDSIGFIRKLLSET
jgi:transcriptional regulator with XRE-family HTH domain